MAAVSHRQNPRASPFMVASMYLDLDRLTSDLPWDILGMDQAGGKHRRRPKKQYFIQFFIVPPSRT